WLAWGEWSNRCLTTGGRTRTRDCSGGDGICACIGDATEGLPCCCPTGGVWTEWAPTSGVCPTTCGSCASVARTRTCSSERFGCPCSGPTTDIGPCNRAPCSSGSACCGGYSLITNPNTGDEYCGTELSAIPMSTCCTSDIVGKWGDNWSEWSGSCNVEPCGICDKQTRSRVCTPGPLPLQCPCDGSPYESRSCGSNKLCIFPKRTCCAPYIKRLINNSLVCA
ncbi:hypothetical protein PMAYCL1PPCAC_11055, partial [Pristionchus mayeri]